MEIKAVEEKKNPSKKMKAGISSLAVGLTLIQKAKAAPVAYSEEVLVMGGLEYRPSFHDYFQGCYFIMFLLGIVTMICMFVSKIFEHFLSKHYDEKNDIKYKKARKRTKVLLTISIVCFSIGVICKLVYSLLCYL